MSEKPPVIVVAVPTPVELVQDAETPSIPVTAGSTDVPAPPAEAPAAAETVSTATPAEADPAVAADAATAASPLSTETPTAATTAAAASEDTVAATSAAPPTVDSSTTDPVATADTAATDSAADSAATPATKVPPHPIEPTSEEANAPPPDPTQHHCYMCDYEEPKDKYTNKQLALTSEDASGEATKFCPTLHYTRRRFRKAGRELQFLDDDEWVWPWTKGVTTEYSVQFVTFDDPKDAEAGTRIVCGTCIRDKHADLWKCITDYNHSYI